MSSIRFSKDEAETILSAAFLGIAHPSLTYFMHFHSKKRSKELENIMLEPNKEEIKFLIKQHKEAC